MTTKQMLAVAAALGALSACGKSGQQASKAAPSDETHGTTASAQVYSGTGTIQKIAGDQVTIKHGPMPRIGWPAMTMTFTAPGDLATGVQVGSEVDFRFRQNGSAYQLTSIRRH
jgi:Cu/Ag efflux protein CusF